MCSATCVTADGAFEEGKGSDEVSSMITGFRLRNNHGKLSWSGRTAFGGRLEGRIYSSQWGGVMAPEILEAFRGSQRGGPFEYCRQSIWNKQG